MFTCKLCLKHSSGFNNYFCVECDKIRVLMEIYPRDKVIEILSKCLVIEKFKKDNEEDDTLHGKPRPEP
jgi:hypothetical protein